MSITLTADKKEAIVSRLQQDIDAADAYYEEYVEPKIRERYAIYHADKAYYRNMFPELSKRSELYTTDVRDTISSALPSLMKTFYGSSDVVTVQGKDGMDEDNIRAEKMQDLINFELEKAHSYLKFSTWFTDALITNIGILKCDWSRSYRTVQKQERMILENFEAFHAAAQESGTRILSVEPEELTGTVLVTYEVQEIDKNEPRLFNLPASEFRFSPDATSLEEADFVAHRKIVSLDYLRKQAGNGLYDQDAIDELAECATEPEYTALEEQNNQHISDEPNQTDSGRRKTVLYECYVRLNVEDDPNALLQDMIVTISNGVILRIEPNTYERRPFFILSPLYEPHKIIPVGGFVDLIAPIQHTKTAILRQMVYNMAQSNDSRMAIDQTALVDVNDLLENRRYIRLNGGANGISSAIMPMPSAQLQPWSFDMLSYLDNAKENRTGITRYNQGMDASSLNKTATGVNIITQQANMRLEQIARNFAETGVVDLFRFLVKMNQLFINEETVIRLTNGPMKIYPDDLSGEFDLEINAAMGASTKQQNIQNLQMIEAMMEKLVAIGLAGPKQIYNVFKKICEELGYKNVDDFIMNPDNQQEALQQQQQQKDGQNPQPEAPINKVSVAYNDLPWQAQAQLLQAIGLQVTPDMFTEKATQDALKEAVNAHAKSDATQDHARGLSDMATAHYLQQVKG